ncbi:MAG: FMN-binding protein, partial [Defluviitaleaceae bacterium]|nr:FMN-binding protein [Defluviitaleaceae bacterium]
GGELPHLEPRAYFPIIVDDHATLGTQLIPGRFNSIPVPGFDVTINIGTCRQVLRHINITSYVRSRVNMNNTTVPTGQAFVSQLTQSELPAGLERAAWSAFVAEILTLYARPVAEGGRTYAAVLEAADIAGHEAFSQAVKGVIVAHIQNYSITIAQQASRIGYFGPRVAATPAPAPDPTPDPTPAPDAPAGGPTTFRPGTHTGTSENTYSHRPDNDGGLTPTTIVVEIIIAADGETVESYRVVSHGETDFWINTLAMPTFTQVVNARGDIAGIDTIVGATYTSYALREAAAAAFNAARN